jgi:hypothetical protein
MILLLSVIITLKSSIPIPIPIPTPTPIYFLGIIMSLADPRLSPSQPLIPSSQRNRLSRGRGRYRDRPLIHYVNRHLLYDPVALGYHYFKKLDTDPDPDLFSGHYHVVGGSPSFTFSTTNSIITTKPSFSGSGSLSVSVSAFNTLRKPTLVI